MDRDACRVSRAGGLLMTRLQLVARIVAVACAFVIVGRLGGVPLGGLPPTWFVVVLLAMAHVAPPVWRRWNTERVRELLRAHSFEIGVGLLVLLSFAVRLPGLNAELGHTPLDIDEGRLGESVK